jgi:general secretion pathway protein B
MSLILEALKKSEQQRRLGEAPTLGSPVLAVRGRRTLLPLFGALIAITIAAGWWLLRPAPPARTTAAPTAETAAPTPPMNRIKPTLVRSVPPRQAETKREPVPTKPMPSAGLEALAPPLPIAPSIADRPGSVTQLPPPTALPATLPPAANVMVPKPANMPAPARPAANAPAPTPTPARPSAAPAATAPALPSVWDLPYATRKDLPDLALTMHVYASDPHERFVVIKGERHIEGDDLGDGVILREIRPDGMVLEFKGTRFVYPRDGG